MILICVTAKPLLAISILIAQKWKDLTDCAQPPLADNTVPFLLFSLPLLLKKK